MLDAYIIDRIRRERERNQRESIQIPLPVEGPRPDDRRRPEREEERPERGSVVIDFHV